jgi:hypothetical protein
MNTNECITFVSAIISNIILLASAIIVVVGWDRTSKLNRKNNVALKRLEYQLEAYKAFMLVDLYLKDAVEKKIFPTALPGFIQAYGDTVVKFRLFLPEHENDMLKPLIDGVIREKFLEGESDKIIQLKYYVQNAIKNVLEIER